MPDHSNRPSTAIPGCANSATSPRRSPSAPSGLDLKTRTLICVVSDTATGRYPELAIHLRMALRQGWTEAELTETLLHLSVYVGLPLVREALQTAGATFAAIRAEA